ncbi:MAG: hypothetical protein J5677_00980 [Bacteroidales bacterium]|nr:hypothetical protein [Bacteroidales bacterium]
MIGNKKIRLMHPLRYFLISLSPYLLISLLFISSCSRDNVCDTPFGEGGLVDITQPDFAALQNVGGTVTVNRGYKGIFVRRISYGEFVAFDCACPHCHEVRLKPMEGWDGGVLECPECHSCYETVNGQPLEGAASGCMLYQYNTHFDGYILEIY